MNIKSREVRHSAFLLSFPVTSRVWSYIITLCFFPAGGKRLLNLVCLCRDLWVAHPSQDSARLTPPHRTSALTSGLSAKKWWWQDLYSGRLIADSSKRQKLEIYVTVWSIFLPGRSLSAASRGTRTQFSTSGSSAVFSQERGAQWVRLAPFLIALAETKVWNWFVLPFHYF